MIAIRLLKDRTCKDCTHQVEWGCTAKRWRTPDKDEPDGPENWVNPSYLPQTVLGEDTFSCPRQTLREDARQWAVILRYYGLYKKGFLPDEGPVTSQSNKLMEIFRALDDGNYLVDQEETKRAERRQNRSSEGRNNGRASR